MSTWSGVVSGVVRDRRLRLLTMAFLGFNAAEYGVWVVLLVYGYGLGGAAGAAGVALLQLIPSAVVGPLGAYAGDRFPRGRVLLVAYLIQATALTATAGALAAGLPAGIVLVVAVGHSVSVTFTRPAHYTVLPDVTSSAAALTGANAVAGLAEGLGMLAGPFLSGVLLAEAGPAAAFGAFAGVMAVGVGLVGAAGLGPATRPAPAMTARQVAAETLRGFAVLRSVPAVRLPIAVLGATQIVVGALDVLLVAAAVDLLQAGEGWAGYLNAAFGLGAVLGAGCAVSLAGRPRMTPSLVGGSVAFGGPLAVLGSAPSLLTAPALVVASGLGRSLASVAGNALLQRSAPPAAIARVFGVLEGATMLGLAIGTVGASALVSVLGIGGALIAAGVFVPLVVAVVWVPLRSLERATTPPRAELLALLRALPIFAPLPAPAIERILASLDRVDVPAGQVLIQEGEPGDRCYLLAEGDADILRDEQRIATRHAPDILGEIALLRAIPRTATVVASTPLVLYALTTEPFLQAVTGHPQALARADQVADHRIAERHLAHAGLSPRRHPASGEVPPRA